MNDDTTAAYNSKLHIVGVYPNGIAALDTYIIIGDVGVIPPKISIVVAETFIQ